MAGPTIIAWGTEEQKERNLRGSSTPTRSGARASRSRTPAATSPRRAHAIEDQGDHFLVNGQKVWSSFAHIADFCILVGQGDPGRAAYKNLTYVIVDMHAPGVEVRPLVQITGHPEFNEIFFTDVKVPKENSSAGRRRLAGRDDDAAARTRHARLRALGDARRRGAQVDRARERAQVVDPILRDRIARESIEPQALSTRTIAR